jgi:hypothetical protein
MDADNNNYIGTERRAKATDRRDTDDRRTIVRFEDLLGRRSGVERRLGIDIEGLVDMKPTLDNKF